MGEPKTFQLPWQGLLALTAALAGAVWYFTPLDTSRPKERIPQMLTNHEVQDVDARLWQDPLLAVSLHLGSSEKDKIRCEHKDFHTLEALTKGMAQNDFWVLPVVVPGGSYAEYNEIRLRTRRAVLEALGTSGFIPNDGEHIGFCRLTDATDKGEEIIPFEWCNRDLSINPQEGIQPRSDKSRVLILWLRDELFHNRPLFRLNSLLDRILASARSAPVRVVGPRTSTALRAMLREAEPGNLNLPCLRGVRMLSPTSTASEDVLLDPSWDWKSSKDLLEARITGFHFERLTTTDGEVTEALIKELALRDVTLISNHCHKNDALDDIALISEWDTFYGRMLPETFIRTLKRLSPRQDTKNVLVYHYLRGVDGLFPTTDDKPQEKQSQDKTKQPSEAIEGLNQADYLRRLARRLKDKDRDLRKDGKDGIKAIGVLGTDIYDKLLVLKSLRKLLPGTLFFTTNLDARFGHPDEWKEAHNLIVGFSFWIELAS